MNNLHIIHIDMDAYFAAIEQRDHREYRGKPVIVGGDPKGRGVVSTASYEARKYGIHSAMSCRKAMELCPQGIFLPVDIARYQHISAEIREIFSRYTQVIEPVSIDEAFLDVLDGDALAIGRSIKGRIQQELRLTASAGISYNKFLAKMASDMEKPDGFTVLDSDRARQLLPTLPIRRIWGVGAKTEKSLNALGIFTISDLLSFDRDFFLKQWGRRGYELLQLAQGIDHSVVQPRQETKSIGEETTLDMDTRDEGVLKSCLKEFSMTIGKRLAKHRLQYRTITVKLKYADFTSITRSITMDTATASSLCIYEESIKILRERVSFEKAVRLIGVQVSNLDYPHAPRQVSFFDPQRPR